MMTKSIDKYILLLCSFWLFITAKGQEAKSNIDLVAKRFCAIYLKENIVNDSISNWLSTIKKDGSWQEFNYKETPKVTLPSIEHLQRLAKMSIAYKSPENQFYKNQLLSNAVHNGLLFWLNEKPQSQNWWFNVIGTPIELAKILLLMDGELTLFERQKGLQWLLAANKDGKLMTGQSQATGQNMIWIAKLQMQAACLQKSMDYMRFSIDNLSSEMKVVAGEGIQSDWSFHQHGPQLYTGGYGVSFAVDCSEVAALLHETDFKLNDTIVRNLSNYILQCQRWMVWGNKIDYSSTGREIARMDKNAAGVATACENMVKLNTKVKASFEALAKNIRNNATKNNIMGNKHFWRSDFMVQRRSNYYTSVKMASNRVYGSESGNGEGEQNYHLGDGCTYIMKTGKEYENIFPLWDWQKVPGVTCRIRNTPLPLITFGAGAQGTTSFVGGVSDERYGMAAFDLSKDSVKGKKAWFYFDDEFVCLGAGISTNIESPIITSINQCFVNGKVDYAIDGNEKRLDKQTVTGNLQWVYHDSVAYIFEGKQSVSVQQEQRSANWGVINKSLSNPRMENGNVFSLWLNHGISVKQETYTYAVVPSIGLNQLEIYKKNKPYKIIANMPALQAVENNGLGISQIAFWQAGSVQILGQYVIKVDMPCLVMIKKETGSLQVSVSNPENKSTDIKVKISSKTRTYKLNFHLLDGQDSGNTTSQSFAFKIGI